MSIQILSPGWRVAHTRRVRAAVPGAMSDLPGLPAQFLTSQSSVAEEVVIEPVPIATRDSGALVAPTSTDVLDLSYDAEPGRTAMLALRYPSGALTFHAPVQSTSRGVRASSQIRFQVRVARHPATRGLAGEVLKAIIIKVAKLVGKKGDGVVVAKAAGLLESAVWKKRGLSEGWHVVSQRALASGILPAAKPVTPGRSLLLLHGTFSNAAAAFSGLATTDFFDRLTDTYGDRIFAFDHFSVSRTPDENARLLLAALPEQATTFDVVTHSRGGLVLRALVERAATFGSLSQRFALGRAVLVASPNDGTPLATPQRWNETVGWLANLLEMLPDHPFTSGAAFVANGIVWIANRASGDLPGLHAMDRDGDPIRALQGPPGPPSTAYSALVSNYQPAGSVLRRLLDAGLDRFFESANDLVVPTEGGWDIDRSRVTSIPAARIGCFGPGGNLPGNLVTHVDFFTHQETADFLVTALLDRPQPLRALDPRSRLPDQLRMRGAMTDGRPVRPAAGIAAVAPTPETTGTGLPALGVTVVNGDLTFESEALLLGHYSATRLTGTEAVMNRVLGGAMKRSLDMGVYPVGVGTHQVFINTTPSVERGSFLPRPKAVIVAGLGGEGQLRPADLVDTVRQAVVAWSQRQAEGRKRVPDFELAATLIGSGGSGVDAGDAARRVAQGVSEANDVLAKQPGTYRLPRVKHLRLIELYLDRATDAWRSLKLLSQSAPGRYEVTDEVRPGIGPLQRPPDSGYRGAEFDFIKVDMKAAPDGVPTIAYTLDTKRARSEVRAQRAQSRLLSELVSAASNDLNGDDQIGRTLFGLLIPPELEAFMVTSGEMQIELDPQTAAIPWELLEPKPLTGDELPWAIQVKLLRKLQIGQFRERVTDAGPDAGVLIIGEPECPADYPRLYGAHDEAVAVRDCLTAAGALDSAQVTALVSPDRTQVGPDARTVVNALFAQPLRIVHISGHGKPGAAGQPGGVVLSNGTFLGPDEIKSMRVVPELVFVNCCHLGAADFDQLAYTRYDRADFASGVAGALIDIGVRCVVAAGWAVDDEVATVFADAFYRSLLNGNRFIIAVADARDVARRRNPQVNTWAAYQCYGDPDWILRRPPKDATQSAAPLADEFWGIGSAISLKIALERNVVQTKFQGYDRASQIAKLELLEAKAKAHTWDRRGDVAELFGQAFVEVGGLERGLAWYERAVVAEDGRASLHAAEQVANVRSRFAWDLVDRAARQRDRMVAREEAKTSTTGSRMAVRHARIAAEQALQREARRSRALVDSAIDALKVLVSMEETVERASLLGAAYKRRALIAGVAGGRALSRDLVAMRASYERARRVAEKQEGADLYYPVSNCLAADVVLALSQGRKRSLDAPTVTACRRSLKARAQRDPDFWSVVGQIELDQFEALVAHRLGGAVSRRLVRVYADLHTRVVAPHMWASVYDNSSLMLPAYARRTTGAQKRAALDLLAQLRMFAHPETD